MASNNKSEEVVDKVEDKSAKEQEIEKALQDQTKKRKAEDEIEIDLNQTVPLSKKQKRLLRRGKVTLEELNEKFNLDPSSVKEYQKEIEGKTQSEKKEGVEEGEEEVQEDASSASQKAKKDKKFGVWIGNLTFDTSKEDLCRFFIAKTKELDPDSRVEESDILRVNLPLAQNDGKQVKNKGFAHMNFRTQKQMDAVIALSESHLNGRNMLIKNSASFDGRPDKNDLISMSKNPPSRILFVGNLSFDTTDELLKKHFQHCGEIVKIRMATFQDTGKCKGFAFVDFKNEEGPTNALKDKTCRRIAGRPLRMEFGEDRSKRQVKRRVPQASETLSSTSGPSLREEPSTSAPPIRERKPVKKHREPSYKDKNNRLKSSVALASAPRASAAIVPSQGKKITF
ncbi:Nop13p [Lachancea thermotolerans CBS 6340]|uniref:KLTH0B06886p n=1 Tax=Lachancea thermotolerans (strain ATCC 56472 / CBS 6340 / NRRL Y-8284) TaxID=559295 RepID=C5DCY7_LACTC|nr:KLTH0B06886p [Lachancea thermotolerans CBS 6340]CAR21648.1 KLTH0B06886p [Lachancea thermotolerans CBS 6340]